MKLPPCVYLKHGSYWYVKRGKWTNLGADERLALAEYARLRGEPVGGMTALIDEALADIRGRKTKPIAGSTYAQYLHAGGILKDKLLDFAPEQVKPVSIVEVMELMKEHPFMANRVLTVARIVFKYALRKRRVDSNPAVGIDRYPEEKRGRLISLDEWISIYWCAGERLQLIMRVSFLTGQRIGDVLAISMDHITPQGIEFTQRKTGAKLTVKWTPELRQAVADAKDALEGRASLTLFRSRTGKSPDYRSVHEQWARACRLAGVEDARPNDQRAQSATAAKKQGKNPTALLGHTNEQMTDRYLRDRQRPEVDGPSFVH